MKLWGLITELESLDDGNSLVFGFNDGVVDQIAGNASDLFALTKNDQVWFKREDDKWDEFMTKDGNSLQVEAIASCDNCCVAVKDTTVRFLLLATTRARSSSMTDRRPRLVNSQSEIFQVTNNTSYYPRLETSILQLGVLYLTRVHENT